MSIIGRHHELEELRLVSTSENPEFLAVYGRRRVGKTFLINQFFHNTFAFKVTGLAERDSRRRQLANFGAALRRYGSPLCPDPADWTAAFDSLRTLLESLQPGDKKVVFIDELPYMYTRKCDLIPALEHFWNDWGNTREDLLLIVCGSATSWIVKNIINNKGGLHNRITRRLYLKPFTLSETKEYLASQGIRFSDRDIAETYMIMGGIPYYLSLIEKGKSLAQNIDEIFFVRKGRLDGEFTNLYGALFEQSDGYIKVVEALGKKSMGLNRIQLSQATGISNGGGLSKILEDLDQCDMIRKYKHFGKQHNGNIYQLTDFYSLFYFKFIQKHTPSDKGFWTFQLNTPAHNTWAGYAFEQLCLYHHQQIERCLGINGILTETSAWQSAGAQIDLVIDRADRIIDLCEIKYWATPFVITKKYAADLEHKMQSFILQEKPSKAVHLVFISTYGLHRNEYAGMAQAEVTLSDLLH